MRVLFSKKIVVFITLVVSSMPIISLSGMIDGISYVKMFLALVCLMPFIPFMLKKINESKVGNLFWTLKVSLLVTVLILLLLIQNDYRGVFGAPGRNNGAISILLYLCFTVFGMYVYMKNSIGVVLHGLVLSSSVTFLISNLHLIYPNLNLFPSLDFNSTQFRDNVDNLAPLASMAFTASLILYLKSRKILYLFLQIPAAYFVIKWQLLQPIISFMPCVVFIVFKVKYTHLRLRALTPLLIGAGYILAIKVLPFTPLASDSSLQERLKIITYVKEIWTHFSLFPIHIDALSDFSTSFVVPNGYLDDFHNVYLQILFSFGLVIGVAIIGLISAPFLISPQQFDKTSSIFPVYLNFFIGLFFAIASPNFMYFGFILIGYFLGSALSNRSGENQSPKWKLGQSFVIYLSVLSVMSFQIHDFVKRIDISATTRAYSSEISEEKYFEKLVDKVSGLRDAEYKYQVARNFYAIGNCALGNIVLEQLVTINAREVRNDQLVELKKLCEQK